MDQPGELVQVLQRMVDTFAGDVGSVQAGLAQTSTPEDARRMLACALRYVLERFDLVPDHIDGLGIVDDAVVLRVACKHAVSAGADDADLRRLAGETPSLAPVFGALYEPLIKFVARLPAKKTRGRTAGEALDDPDARMQLWRDLLARIRGYQPHALVPPKGDAAGVLRELRKMMEPRLRKAGLLK